MDPNTTQIEQNLMRLEQRLRVFQILFGIGALALIAVVCFAWQAHAFQARNADRILRVRGLIIEDEKGRERILIGAPVPGVAGRKRRDGTAGVIILGENGADRVALASPLPAPQSDGHVGDRIGEGAGLVLNDKNGNERGGFGVIDSDSRIVLGLDNATGGTEAIAFGVLPGAGASFEINDSKGRTRLGLSLRGDSAAKLYGLNWPDENNIEAGIVQLSPFATKHAVIKADDRALDDILRSMKP